MIALDIETSGLFPERCGTWQIGAIDLETRMEFLEEARIDDRDEVIEEALRITGKTEEELRDKSKQTQKELIEHFFKWVEKSKIRNFIVQNPSFDVSFLSFKARRYGLELPYHHRTFDLHSIASLKYFQVYGKFLIKEDKESHSDMGLSNIIKFCGMKDERVLLEEGKIVQEGKPHNALEDAKLTAECFSRLVYGNSLFPEYTKFKIPEYLKK